MKPEYLHCALVVGHTVGHEPLFHCFIFFVNADMIQHVKYIYFSSVVSSFPNWIPHKKIQIMKTWSLGLIE